MPRPVPPRRFLDVRLASSACRGGITGRGRSCGAAAATRRASIEWCGVPRFCAAVVAREHAARKLYIKGIWNAASFNAAYLVSRLA